MSNITSNKILTTLRQLISEIRHTNSSNKLTDSLLVKYIFSQYHKFKVTDQQLCKARQEAKFMAESYLCYLRSVREYNELYQHYLSKGERSIEDTANLVGFKLPHDPK
ncbi:protein FMC1 homolog [Lycorma delicatula]|uniref:protein FMC1 homolog n=1 Tax=Lycorma delicatula TaxID=130591 RepID=UPI003F51943B